MAKLSEIMEVRGEQLVAPTFEEPEDQEFIPGSINEDRLAAMEAEAGIETPATKTRAKYGSKKRAALRGTARDEKEVAKRFKSLLTGATGLPALARPHFQMTDEEAEDISEPLAAYMVRQEPLIPLVQEILDYTDVAAFSIATLAYIVRVWIDDAEYRSYRRLARDTEQPDHIERITRPRNQANGANPVSPEGSEEVGGQGDPTQGGGDVEYPEVTRKRRYGTPQVTGL